MVGQVGLVLQLGWSGRALWAPMVPDGIDGPKP